MTKLMPKIIECDYLRICTSTKKSPYTHRQWVYGVEFYVYFFDTTIKTTNYRDIIL